ncbi:MAG: helix-turn-helix transcriptional regulator [Actinomycetota bacterium]|nr:helix-turn-helix transcriptional regulator [Actinomycetota bacterium]
MEQSNETFFRAVYVISVAAELAGVHPQTLRIYERRGLLDPQRTSGGSRRYSEKDLARLRHIQELTDAGINIEGVKRILELEDKVEGLSNELAEIKHLREVELEEAHRKYRRDIVPRNQAFGPILYYRFSNEQ